MKAKIFRRLPIAGFAMVLLACSFTMIQAQENEQIVVDQVIAQVNDDVIMLSLLQHEMRDAADAISKQDNKPIDVAKSEVTKRRAEIIATLVNEQLLLQKGKELELSNDVEADVNRRIMDVAKEQGLTTIEQLRAAMAANGMDLDTVRQTLRIEVMKNAVLQREVDAKIYFGLSSDELHKYFDAHKDQFKKPAVVVLSEIFLSYAGKNAAEVEAKATQLVAQARGGSEFRALAAANSERMDEHNQRVALQTGGLVGTFEMPKLRDDIAKAIKNLKTGGTSDPVKSDEGIQIIHIDQLTEGSDASVFVENQVREAIAIERAPAQRDIYLQTLRNDAYIKINDDYAGEVLPLLKIAPPVTASVADASGTSSVSKDDGSKKSKSKHWYFPF